MNRFRLLVIIFILMGNSVHAQRLIPGTSEISVYAGKGFRMRSETGRVTSGVEYGYIDNIGKTTLGLNWGGHKQRFPIEVAGINYSPYYDIRKDDIYVSAGWMAGVVKNRRRSVVLWTGLTVSSGIRLYTLRDKADPVFSSMNQEVDMIFPPVSFIYGFSPQVRFEFFPGRVWSLSAFIKGNIQFVEFFKKDRERLEQMDESVVIPRERWFFPEIGFNFSYFFSRM